MAAGSGFDADVLVVGAGPVGLMLAAELRLVGAEVIVLERRGSPATESRASTLHARTMEIFDSRGLLDALGVPPNEPRGHFGGLPLDLTLPTRYPGQWKVPQTRTEELLGEWARTLGADLRRGWDVLELSQDEDGVAVEAATGSGVHRVRAAYLVACDGQDSTVRKLIAAPFPGRAATRRLLRADVAGIEIPNRRFERLPAGLAIAARDPRGVTRVMVHEFGAGAEAADEPDFALVIDAWKRVTGEDISAGEPLWVNAFDDGTGQLTSYRDRRVLFAGDAAHRQLPAGGQALNLGLQDAVNLGWKLALRRHPQGPPELLDSYHAERRAAGARVVANTRVQAMLLMGGPEVEPLRSLITELIAAEPTRRYLAGLISGLDVRYAGADPAGDHPLLGARLDHADLYTVDGPASTTALLRTGRGVLIDFAENGCLPRLATRWADRVVTVCATPPPDGPLWDVPAILLRPDGYVGWIGADPEDAGAALTRWFGQGL